jgi:hypothetical protein
MIAVKDYEANAEKNMKMTLPELMKLLRVKNVPFDLQKLKHVCHDKDVKLPYRKPRLRVGDTQFQALERFLNQYSEGGRELILAHYLAYVGVVADEKESLMMN